MKNTKYGLDQYNPIKRQSDCDVILDDFDDLFGSIGNCLDAAFDEKKSKMQVIGGIFGLLKPASKLLWDGTSCAVKNTPKAIATVASIKREITDTVTEEYYKYKKELKEQELAEKIAQLKEKSK